MSAVTFRFWRSVLVVLTGSAAAQAIPLIGSLIIARLFTPAEFGQFATWIGFVAVGTVAITGRYEMALAIEHDGFARRVATRATLLVVLCGGILLTLLAALCEKFWLRGAFPPQLVWLIGPTAAVVAASQTLQSRAAADGNYRDLGIIRIAQAGAITGVQILIGLLDPSAYGLALAHLGGAIIGVLLAQKRLSVVCDNVIGKPAFSMVEFLYRQRRFPMLALPADLVNTVAAQIPLLIIANRFGADEAGLLALTLRIVGAPIGLLGASVLDVFRRRSASSYALRGECQKEYINTLKILTIGSVFVMIFLLLIAESTFALIFGEIWRKSGTFATWLMPMFALRFVASPLSYMFYVANKQHLDLIWQLALLVTTLASLWLPLRLEMAIQCYGLGYALLYCVYLAMSYSLSKGGRK
jgi:O-antigen/teichoic acid export membrane protein